MGGLGRPKGLGVRYAGAVRSWSWDLAMLRIDPGVAPQSAPPTTEDRTADLERTDALAVGNAHHGQRPWTDWAFAWNRRLRTGLLCMPFPFAVSATAAVKAAPRKARRISPCRPQDRETRQYASG